MILVDMSSTLHRMIFGSTKDPTLPKDKSGKILTESFIYYTMYMILSELIELQIKYQNYGKLVICFDDYKKAYWRRDSFPEYKQNRRDVSTKDESPINYKEVYAKTNELFEQIRKNTPWKCLYINRAEADDIILVLAKEYYQEGVLIYSPDKDFIQSQRLPGIKQYSALTKKWITPDTKHGDMKKWIYQHVMLGDESDGVPKVIDNTEFSESFTNHILKCSRDLGCNYPTDVKSFKALNINDKRKILECYKEKLYNRKGQEIGYDIYMKQQFGISHIEKILNGEWHKKQYSDKINIQIKELKDSIITCSPLQEELRILKLKLKQIKKTTQDTTEIKSKIQDIQIKIKNNQDNRKQVRAKIKELQQQVINFKDNKTEEQRLDDFLDSHPLYRENYNRNYEMVMEEGIPDYIRANIIMEYNSCDTDYNEEEFEKYLDDNKLSKIKTILPKVFQSNTEIDISNCGWDF